MRRRLEEAEEREKAYVESQKRMYEKLATSRTETTTPRNTTTGKTPFTAAAGIYHLLELLGQRPPRRSVSGAEEEAKRSNDERENLRIQKDIRALVSYQRRRQEQQQAKIAESAANLLRGEEDDEFQGILGIRLDSEIDEEVMSLLATSLPMIPTALPTAFPKAFQTALPARQNPNTVYPAPGERNRPRGGTKDFNMTTWVADTTVVMLVKQMCEKSEAFRSSSKHSLRTAHSQNHKRKKTSQDHLFREDQDNPLWNRMKSLKNRY